MTTILAIAFNTFRETIRNRVLYNILFFAIGILFLSVSFGEWSVFARVQVMQDFGLATMSLTGMLLAVFIGVGMLGREIAAKTLYHILVRPIRRVQFVFGKWLGLFTTLMLNFAVMSVVFHGVTLAMGGSANPSILQAIVLIGAELAVVVSVSILFSSLTTPMLAAIFTLAFYIAGHFNDLLELEMVGRTNPVLATLLRVIYYLLPNLGHFNIRSRIVYGLSVPPDYVWLALLYGALYTTLFLLLSCLVFNRKDL